MRLSCQTWNTKSSIIPISATFSWTLRFCRFWPDRSYFWAFRRTGCSIWAMEWLAFTVCYFFPKSWPTWPVIEAALVLSQRCLAMRLVDIYSDAAVCRIQTCGVVRFSQIIYFSYGAMSTCCFMIEHVLIVEGPIILWCVTSKHAWFSSCIQWSDRFGLLCPCAATMRLSYVNWLQWFQRKMWR